MTRPTGINRRAALLLGAGSPLVLCPGFGAFAAGPSGFDHAYSPLGTVKYSPGFAAFDYVNPAAPKGGTMRFARMGAFDTSNTLTYPGRPPSDIRLIYDRLIIASEDERATYYGVLADGVRVSDDFTIIEFSLNPKARWHDGNPVSAMDVAFTFETLKAKGAPFYRQAFRPLTATAQTERLVVFENDRVGDRDVVRRLSTIPIHPAHVWADLAEGSAPPEPIGSGPFRVASIDAPRRLELERVGDYWGRDLPVNRGRWNADRLVFHYFRDAAVAHEAFRADEYDIRSEDNPTRWQTGYDGPDLQSGAIQRSESPSNGVGQLHGIVFNLRNPLLSDRRVRLAMALSFDFEQINRTLFGGAFEKFDSVFGETDLASSGPAGDAEAALIGINQADLPVETAQSPNPFDTLPNAGSREALAESTNLFAAAGLSYRDGRLIDPATNQPMTLRLVSPNPVYDRALGLMESAWDRLGISIQRSQGDRASSSRQLLARDFDLATLSWSPAQLPGTAERLLWHSDLADQEGSYALSGLKNQALDRTIEALERARDEASLQVAGRAFDRVFRQIMPMVPLWRSSTIRMAWWNRYGRPEAELAGFPPSPIDRWWAA